MVNNAVLHPHPSDATLTVARAAEVLGVHPNTVRAWSDSGRIRHYRINPRGDRRYRIGDLNRFLAATAVGPELDPGGVPRPGYLRRPPPHTAAATSWPTAAEGQSGSRSDGLGARNGASDAGAADTRSDGLGARNGVPDAEAADVRAALSVMSGLGRAAAAIGGTAPDPEAVLGGATRTVREGAGFTHASVWRAVDGRLEQVAVSGPTGARLHAPDGRSGIAAAALGRPGTVVDTVHESGDPVSIAGIPGRRLACAIPGSGGPWGVLHVVTQSNDEPRTATRELVANAADVLGSIIHAADAATTLDRRVHWAEALGRVAADIGSRLDTDQLLTRLVDHAIAMFDGDRAAVFGFQPDGSRRTAAARGLSTAYLTALAADDVGSITLAAVNSLRPAFAVNYRDDPRGARVRARVVQEGYDTICVAPLMDGETREPIGSLNVYHDRPHPWSDGELNALSRLADQAGLAIRSAKTYAQLATWAAQLQSIQQLGARLNRLSDVAAIGAAIATELRDLIDYHNVRVYRKYGEDLIPVAMLGQVGEYIDETQDQLRIKVGEGITGWVAAHRVAEHLPDAAADPRANTIPGTSEIDESMLLAPMVFEDEVLGVLVLSKLGLSQFTSDDLRLLVIYASFAAQAMAHADATMLLKRQLQSRRDLLEITESILGTLDTGSVLASVADRLEELVGWDNVWIELLDENGRDLVSVIAKGINAEAFATPSVPGESGITTWVLNHNEGVLVPDEFHDSRVLVGEGGPIHGGLICVPLHGRTGAIGVLAIERLGEGRSFTEDEFELVQLFAAQVSIAVQNARTHGVVTRQAETDDLTGLRNHRSFRHALAGAVAAGDPFSLLMIDLDGFKHVNDSFGHEAGNAFLQRVASSIVAASRDTDAVFRYGGDEFVVILPGTDGEHILPVADRVRRAFVGIATSSSETASTTATPTEAIKVEASAGVATFPTDGTTAEAILLAADRACFLVKREGGGRVAMADEAAELADAFTLKVPTPIDAGP
ncbi:MAG: GAF domain-containing protein [Chloroflexi bacterium]|nr:GAF domain-containing protein [Chloroflexota bacterium]